MLVAVSEDEFMAAFGPREAACSTARRLDIVIPDPFGEFIDFLRNTAAGARHRRVVINAFLEKIMRPFCLVQATNENLLFPAVKTTGKDSNKILKLRFCFQNYSVFWLVVNIFNNDVFSRFFNAGTTFFIEHVHNQKLFTMF